MKVLIAEDNIVNQLLLRIYMKKLGWEYLIVENGLWAIEACRTGDFNAILMDINMPELNGIEATNYIRSFNSEIPIIALTANRDDQNRIKCAKAGMNALIEKPVSLNSIQDIITGLVSNNKLIIA
jgi:CheY-like chemotaxis protein